LTVGPESLGARRGTPWMPAVGAAVARSGSVRRARRDRQLPARISHQPSTAAARGRASPALRLDCVLDVLQVRLRARILRAPCICAPSHRLATNSGEKYGLDTPAAAGRGVVSALSWWPRPRWADPDPRPL